MDEAKLISMLSKMDVPNHRIDHLNKINIEWLYKNLAKRNSEHELFNVVFAEIQRRMEQKIWAS